MPLSGLSPYGHPKAQADGSASPLSAATLAFLLTIALTDPARTHGNEAIVHADQSQWIYDKNCALAGDNVFVATPADNPATGRWLRKCGQVDIALPFTFATVDAAVLLTLPTGVRMKIKDLYWKVTTSFTGGTTPAIGVSSTKTGFTTKGDLLGGASGELTAALVSTGVQGIVPGTIGPKLDTVAELKAAMWLAGDDFRFDRIASAFTAGVGEVHIVADLLANPGA